MCAYLQAFCGQGCKCDAISDDFADTNTSWEKRISLLQCFWFLATTILLNSSCICSFFANATLLKAGPGFQYILNIIIVVDSADSVNTPSTVFWTLLTQSNYVLKGSAIYYTILVDLQKSQCSIAPPPAKFTQFKHCWRLRSADTKANPKLQDPHISEPDPDPPVEFNGNSNNARSAD